WYPGDEYVDMIGADIYLPAGTHTSSFIMFDNLASIFGGRKIITMSENGPMPDPERMFVERAAWNWFGTWGGDFITDGLSNSAAHINAVFNHEYVITLDEMNAIDAIIASLDEQREAWDEEEVLSTEDSRSSGINYQNPIQNNRLVLSSRAGQKISKVIIFNMQGKVEFIREHSDDKSSFDFDFVNKASGVYLAMIYTAKGTRLIRFIKP
ncbi:MAG TPA: glycosyl hydrolase, partial [Chryseolinea sp.]